MQALAKFAGIVDAINALIGRALIFCVLGTVLICATVVFLRYVLSIGYGWMQELYVWLHGIVFMLGAGYTLMRNAHVRVDIFYGAAAPRRKAWIDLIGTFVALLPWLMVLAWTGWPYILWSWELGESSPHPGGMPALYLLKSVILVFCLLLGLQGLAVAARSLLVLAGRDDLLPVSGPEAGGPAAQ